MKQLFINTPEDMQWLLDTALKSSNINTRDGEVPKAWQGASAIVFGNEDCPDRVEMFDSTDPNVGDRHLLYVMNEHGKYDETYVPEARTRSGGTRFFSPGHGDTPDDDAERNCAHEWNQTMEEADESGTRIYCLKCGQDGDA